MPNYTLRRLVFAVLALPLALVIWSLGYITLDILANAQGATWGRLIETYPYAGLFWILSFTILPNLK